MACLCPGSRSCSCLCLVCKQLRGCDGKHGSAMVPNRRCFIRSFDGIESNQRSLIGPFMRELPSMRTPLLPGSRCVGSPRVGLRRAQLCAPRDHPKMPKVGIGSRAYASVYSPCTQYPASHMGTSTPSPPLPSLFAFLLGLPPSLGKVLTLLVGGVALWGASMEKVLCCRLDLTPGVSAEVLGTAKGLNGPRAISKTMKWVLIVLCS